MEGAARAEAHATTYEAELEADLDDATIKREQRFNEVAIAADHAKKKLAKEEEEKEEKEEKAAAAAEAALKKAEEEEAARARAVASELALWGFEALGEGTPGEKVEPLTFVHAPSNLSTPGKHVHHIIDPSFQADYKSNKRELAQRLGGEANEQYLLHGTSVTNSDGIIAKNFFLSKVRPQLI